MRKIVACFLTIVMLLACTACGTNLKKYAGVYRGQSMTTAETNGEADDLGGTIWDGLTNGFMNMVISAMTIELHEDGTGALNLGYLNSEFEWTVKGNEIVFNGDNAPTVAATVDGDVITLTSEDTTIVFIKETEKNKEAVAATSAPTDTPDPTDTPEPTSTPAPDLTVSEEYFEAIFAAIKEEISEEFDSIDFYLDGKLITVDIVGNFNLDLDKEFADFCLIIARLINNTAIQANPNIVRAEGDDIGNLFDYYKIKISFTSGAKKKTYYFKPGMEAFKAVGVEVVKGTSTPKPQLACEVSDMRVNVFTNSIGTIYAHVTFSVTNTGTENLYFSTSGFDLEDEKGNLVATNSMTSIYPEVLAPGEKAYVSEFERLDEKVENLAVVPRVKAKLATVELIRYKCSDITVKDETYGGVKVLGRIENNTKQDEDGWIYVVVNLFDKDGKFLHQVYTIISENLPAGAKFGFECTSLIDPVDLTADQVASYEIYAFPSQWQLF